MTVHGVRVLQLTDDVAVIAGYAVTFGEPDEYQTTWSSDTDYGPTRGVGAPVFYDHAMRSVDHQIGVITETRTDARGLWVQAELQRNADYVQEILTLIDENALGWSVGAAGHLIRQDGPAIRRWPIAEVSLTPTPAQPRTLGTVVQVRTDVGSPISSVIRSTEETMTETVATAGDATATPPPAQDAQIRALMDQVGALTRYLESEPPVTRGYVTQDGGTADKNIRNLGDFFVSVRRGDEKRLREVYKSTRALNEGTGSDGGFLVPQEFIPNLLGETAQAAIVRPRAFVQPMRGSSVTLPALNVAATPATGTTSAFGGVVATWASEGGALTATQPDFNMIELKAKKLGGYAQASAELLADNAVGLEALLTRLFAGAVAWHEDYAFLRGDGVNKPLGILNAPALYTVSRKASGNDLELADLGGMLARLYRSNSATNGVVWIIHQSLLTSLVELAATSTVVAWAPQISQAMPMTLYGYPIAFTDKVPASGTKGDIILADLSQYVIGDRQQIAISMSEHASFTSDLITWKFTHRVDGQPWVSSTIVGPGSYETAPFVVLS